MTILDSLISNAYAGTVAAAPQPQQGGSFSLVMMIAVFIFFIYFTVWRPQNKRLKEQRELLNSLAKGDEVMTTGGILGKIAKLTDHYIVLSVSDTVEMTIQKSSIASVLPKGTLKSI